MKKILFSLTTIGLVGALGIWGTTAYFSDTEVSEGNTFTAGSIDLKIDSDCHYFTQEFGDQVYIDRGCAESGEWESTDLTTQKFFAFDDVKPGDWGENTLSLTVEDNDAYVCMNIGNMENNENTLIDPEEEAGDETAVEGELAENLHFTAWLDQGTTAGFGNDTDGTEGDNIWQGAELEPLLFTNESGPASDVLDGKTYALADATVFGGQPLTGGLTHYIGLAWCAGDMDTTGGAIACDGATMGNEVQTDSLTADLSFYAVQSRNNSQFDCDSVVWPAPTPIPN